ncbi:MAG: ATP:cob(I)alamin adenosyltransferase [Nitrospinae bacterium CG11_big_fil_rev_8_21_14_0_20_56_8]|nr:MAG: ATP:cob(I)alamin adenosyltransferase [Nitrospinae bacterium CG11_big_fil_rev_8_21_14_0_20_56_8]
MVRINKVYTRKGDAGETGLGGGNRILKCNPRVEAYGEIDELNSLIGLVRCFNLQKPGSVRRDKLEAILQQVQQKLFDLGSILATLPKARSASTRLLAQADVDWLEEVIDAMNEELEPLNSFVLPGGSPVNAFMHQARTVCRRAERRIVSLGLQEKEDPLVLAYVNRLSDALFVFGRWTAAHMGEAEFLWQPGSSSTPDWRWK